MNIPQENACAYASYQAAKANNWIDCDSVQEAINQVQECIDNNSTSDEALEAIGYLHACLRYRKDSGCKPSATDHALEAAEEAMLTIKTYESLLSATEQKNQSAIDWWMRQAKSGQVMRIM